MEMLSGGDILRRLINRVLKDQIPTELYISHLFKGVVLALQSIHEKAYLHRDLKYNNIILVSDRDDSSVKIIDFGSMIKLPEGDGSCVREELVGTPGFYAPESISRSEYSFKTDIWQIGCILYWSLSPLSLLPPLC
jgi:serine/threonine protein kinase